MRIINEGKKLTEGSVSTEVFYASCIEEVIAMIRTAQIAELDATNLYEKIAQSVDNLVKYNENQIVTARIPELDKIASTMRDIANEEKVHSGELQKLLSLLDKDEDSFYLQGRQEVGEIWKSF